MKNLTEYTKEATSKLLDEMGAFFAFGDKQFNEKKKEGVKYCQMGIGLICPNDNAQKWLDGISKIHTEGIEQDKKENGKEAIITRELWDYESFYSGDFDDAVTALQDYGYTFEDIQTVYYEVLPTVD